MVSTIIGLGNHVMGCLAGESISNELGRSERPRAVGRARLSVVPLLIKIDLTARLKIVPSRCVTNQVLSPSPYRLTKFFHHQHQMHPLHRPSLKFETLKST